MFRQTALILGLMDRFGESILKNTTQILKFIKNMMVDAEEETNSLALSLLCEILSNGNRNFWITFDCDYCTAETYL